MYSEYFGQVVDGVIKKLNLKRGTIAGLGKNSPDSTYIAKGYLPDSATQRLQGPQYIINGEQIDKVYTVVDIPEEEMHKTYLASCESAVDAHILAQVTSLGYDTIDSISKYLRPSSPFYAECSALADWIDACWTKCHELLNVGELITVEQLIEELPVYDN